MPITALTTCLLIGLAAAHDPGVLHRSLEVPPMPCNYSTHHAPVAVQGAVPAWLKGTFYKAIYHTKTVGPDGHTPGDPSLSAVMSVHFSGGEGSTPEASFEFVQGTQWSAFCKPHLPLPTNFSAGNAITITSGCGPKRVCVVTATPEAPAVDGDTLDTVAAPNTYQGSLGEPQLPSPPGMGPAFWQSGHMPTDVNGDVYGLLYIYKPVPGYRVYRIMNGTNQREVLADLPVSRQPGRSEQIPSYNHQAVGITENFLLLPEMPVVLDAAQPAGFNWTSIQDSWDGEGILYWNVLDKQTGTRLGRYELPASWTWHNINAWENSTHITVDISWARNASALNGFLNGGVFSTWPGKLARVTMPNPTSPGASLHGPAVMRDLTCEGDPSVRTPEFGVINPLQMWRRPTRYIWASSVDMTLGDHPTSWTSTFRVDTETGEVHSHAEPGVMPGAPLFIPRDSEQSAESAAGVVLVNTLTDQGEVGVKLIDGESHERVASLKLPIPALPSLGLHNHWSELPTSV